MPKRAFKGILAALLLKWLYGIPYVVSLRGSDVPGFRSYDFKFYHQLLAPLIRLVWRNSAGVVANSQGLREMAMHFYPDIPIQVIPNGVDNHQFIVGSRQWNPPVLLTVGRLVYQKGIDILFRGLAAVKELDWKLFVVGDGKDRLYFEKLTTQFGIDDRVKFEGWQAKDNLIGFYRKANLYLHLSHDEGMSNAILEAMACGLPVVATGVAGNMEVIIDGKTGRLIPPADHLSLGNILEQLLPDPGIRKTMGLAGRERVVQDYTWDQTAQAYLDLIDKLVRTD